MHFGMWASVLTICGVYKDGVPKLKHLKDLFLSVLIISVVMAVFSSNSQTHMIEHFLTK
jgi:hypothetical protein